MALKMPKLPVLYRVRLTAAGFLWRLADVFAPRPLFTVNVHQTITAENDPDRIFRVMRPAVEGDRDPPTRN